MCIFRAIFRCFQVISYCFPVLSNGFQWFPIVLGVFLFLVHMFLPFLTVYFRLGILLAINRPEILIFAQPCPTFDVLSLFASIHFQCLSFSRQIWARDRTNWDPYPTNPGPPRTFDSWRQCNGEQQDSWFVQQLHQGLPPPPPSHSSVTSILEVLGWNSLSRNSQNQLQTVLARQG